MTLGSTPEARLVDIVSGSFGAGHDAAAREIARLLQARGYATRTSDVVDLMPGRLGHALRAGYLHQVQSAPGHLELAAAGPRDAPRRDPGRRPGARRRRARAAGARRGPARS